MKTITIISTITVDDSVDDIVIAECIREEMEEFITSSVNINSLPNGSVKDYSVKLSASGVTFEDKTNGFTAVISNHEKHYALHVNHEDGAVASDYKIHVDDHTRTNGQLYIDIEPVINNNEDHERLSSFFEIATNETYGENPVVRIGNDEENIISVWHIGGGKLMVEDKRGNKSFFD